MEDKVTAVGDSEGANCLELIHTNIPNRHLVGLISEYQGDAAIDRLHKLLVVVKERKQLPYSTQQFEKFGRRLNNPRSVALFLSMMYCKVFHKTQPTRPIKKTYSYTCQCKRQVHFKKPVLRSTIYCDNCAPDRWWKSPEYYSVGSYTPHVLRIPKTTRAFDAIQHFHENEMMRTAEHIHRLCR